MTTRQQKRAKRSQLIHQLQRLEIQHQRVSGADFIISSCKGCEICTKIREIGEQLAPSNVDACTDAGLTVERYTQMREKGMKDKEIAVELMVSTSSVAKWKLKFNVSTTRGRMDLVRKEVKPPGRPTGKLKEFEISSQAYIDLRNQGLSVREISERLGCSRNWLFRWRKQNGLADVSQKELLASNKIDNYMTVDEYRSFKNDGKTDKELAKLCDVCIVSFRQWKRDNGLAGLQIDRKDFKYE